MKSIFLVEHSYELDGCDETKMIGVFHTRAKAKRIVKKYQKLPGFNKYPNDFYIEEYVINETEWQEGFVRVEE